MRVAFYVRPDHPEGYGQPGWDKPGLRAHGYAAVAVKCKDDAEVEEVTRFLSTEGLVEPFGHTYPWYGGRMDLAFVTHGNVRVAVGGRDNGATGARVSVGDNRFIGLYSAAEVLRGAP